MIHDGTIFLKRMGDPSSWTGDWTKQGPGEERLFREGHYPTGEKATEVRVRMQSHQRFVVGMAVRGLKSKVIAAVLGVSREAVDQRLRPLGLKNRPGQYGRPVKCAACAAMPGVTR